MASAALGATPSGGGTCLVVVDAVRGNEVATYFKMLSYDLKQLELKNMKLKAQRRVPKLNACAMVLLGSIVLLFLGVLSVYIFANMGPLY